MSLIAVANPTRFLALLDRLLPLLSWATAFCFAVGLYAAFFVAPQDYQQGETVRIMFIHVPAAWLGMFGWTLMSVAALGTLVWRHPLADVALKTAAPLGAAFTFVCLVTGSLGAAHVGNLLGLGCAPHLGPGTVFDVPRHDCPVAGD